MRLTAKLFLASLLVQLCASGAPAQEAPEQTPAAPDAEWLSVEPAGEEFKVMLPAEPSVSPQQRELGPATLTGQLYSVEEEDRRAYKIWSLRNPRPASPTDPDAFSEHLDACAGLAWKLLAEDAARRSGDGGQPALYMKYDHETPGGVYFMREYNLTGGVADIFSDGERIFIVATYGRPESHPNVKRFLNSFAVKLTDESGATKTFTRASRPDAKAAGEAGARGPGRGGNVANAGAQNAAAETDYTRPFTGQEVTRRAVITFKPEPQFTEEARRFAVSGLVKLRVLLGADGQVGQILVDKRLAHGMTEKSVEAARRLRFTTAVKDGRAVSQWIVIEYNFNPL